MHKALVSVPVLLYIWTRPDKLKQVFEVIKQARPSTLFLISDGPRVGVDADKAGIEASKKLVEDIDWDCVIHKLYFDVNHGLYQMFKNACEFAFKHVDRFVFLEDDVVTSVSFFKYCEILLEKYKDDLRVNMICGMNHLGCYEEPNSDYFFTRGAASIWGFALWKRTYDTFYNLSYQNDSYMMERILENSEKYKSFGKIFKGYALDDNYKGHIPGPEFFLGLSSYSQNQLSIIPTKNMVCNIGYGNNARNSGDLREKPKSIARLFNMKTYDYEFPINHPKYVFEDKTYEKRVMNVLGRKYPLLIKTEWILRYIYFHNKKVLILKLYKKLFN